MLPLDGWFTRGVWVWMSCLLSFGGGVCLEIFVSLRYDLLWCLDLCVCFCFRGLVGMVGEGCVWELRAVGFVLV